MGRVQGALRSWQARSVLSASGASCWGLAHWLLGWSESSEQRLKSEALVWVERAVEGRLEAHSGLDSRLSRAPSMHQSGKRWGDSDGTARPAGVRGALDSSASDTLSKCSMLGRGMSAAATWARNCSVAAEGCAMERLLSRSRRGLGHGSPGSGSAAPMSGGEGERLAPDIETRSKGEAPESRAH
ncbi:hypothetical protein CDD82_2489 [Ophiocordyceps australis]|uniref:Uncharacterized protein n=1 Tax=Ophiocordyceps australis TaxID=1399860 RepID=A0A2C5XQ48_9HYPO|nr:hypothetical protein CDD82_2489 [Ophiocordyceps australis]